ncbi:MAG TPA: ABC transporter ATP-binding protein [Abditibacterium sp.]|jgi:lipopolysaccharide transport system ATP-binding protein
MTDIAIRVENLSKLYRIGQVEKATTFRESLVNAAGAPLRRLKERRLPSDDTQNTFWALRDVSFEVKRGEVIGIVGRNGAGKSTLLKVLSRITGPTKGRAQIHGRVGSLLEVGTGFHPELTGRENIFMNGAILGMSRQEIRSKFDEIVAFSEVEKFLDTPVKRYSSGMYTRLAFSVAAHLEPEIMIVDEVLAVGDMAFQQKCLGKMNQVATQGRTVLFVSHNMAAVESLCSRIVILDSGQVNYDGATTDGLRRYYELGRGNEIDGLYIAPDEVKGSPTIVRASVTDEKGGGDGQFACGAPLRFRVECQGQSEMARPDCGIAIENKRGLRITTLHTKCDPHFQSGMVGNAWSYECQIEDLVLAPGQYVVKLGLSDSRGQILHNVENAMTLNILPTDFFGNSGKRVGGVVYCRQEWKVEKENTISITNGASNLETGENVISQ